MNEAFVREAMKKFMRCHKQRPTLLLGNGPTLTDWYPHLEALREDGYLTIGMNRSHLPPRDTKLERFRADYHCIINAELLTQLLALTPPPWTERAFTGWSYKRRVGTRTDVSLIPQVGWERQWRFDLHRGTDARFTGMMALQLAVYMGCSPIFLLGYDTHPKESHHWGGAPPGRRTSAQRAREFHIEDMRRAAARIQGLADIEVWNANENSAIDAFPHGRPEIQSA